MTNIRKHISTLTMPEKVELFNDLYGELSGYGTEGDTELAHVNTFEARLLKSIGGSGTINEITGLRQFGGGGQPPPPQSTVTQTASFPPELRPFVKDVLTQGQAEFERQQEEGFQQFPGAQLADFKPEQLAAQEAGRQQFTGLAGTPLGQASTYYEPALAATALGTAEIGTEDIQRRMDPFLQNVVDVAKREAIRDEEAAVQGRAAQAVGAGSFGGTRHALIESEGERNLAERLGDIQARGLSSAFQNAQQAAEAQRAREMTGGRQFAALGDITGARARSDLSGLAGIGEIGQQREQQALDLARREFLEEQAFPQTSLQQYASLIRGFPLQASQQRFAQETLPTPSLAQTLIGGAGTAAGLYGAFGGFKKEGGLVGLQGGGQPMMGQQQPNELDTIEMLRQRGAAIRGLSEPVSRRGGGVVQPTGFGPAMNKGIIEMLLRKNPKVLKKFGIGGGRKTGYTEFNPGTQGGQYAGGGLLSVVNRKTEGSLSLAELGTDYRKLRDIGYGGDPELAKLVEEARLKELGIYDTRSERLSERLEGLDDRERREQWGNFAKLMSQFGSTTSPAAQQPGARGLLGAFSEAGAATLPAFLDTSDKYYGKQMDIEDLLSDTEAQKLQAETGIAEGEYERSVAKQDAERSGLGTTLQIGTDLIDARNDALTNSLTDNYKTGDVNAAYRAVGSLMPNAVIQEVAGEMMFDSKAMGTKAAFEASNIIADYMSALTFAESQGMTTVQGHDYAKEKIMPRLKAIAIKDTTSDSLPIPSDDDINDLRQAIKDQGIDAPELDPTGKPTGVSVILSFATNFGLTEKAAIELATTE